MLDPKRYIYLSERILKVDLEDIREFCEQSHMFFTDRIDKYKDTFDPSEQLIEDEQMAVSDTLAQLRGHVDLSNHYGVLMVFAIWEDFLSGVYEYTRRLSTIPELRNAKIRADEKRMSIGDYRDYFQDIGMGMPDPPFHWARLIQLQNFRNAIAHQRGKVTEDNFGKLKKYDYTNGVKYKVGQYLSVSLEYVLSSVTLVMDTCHAFSKEYLTALEKLKILEKR